MNPDSWIWASRAHLGPAAAQLRGIRQAQNGEMVLARGADPNAHICASGTPLFVAYGQKDQAMIELLERHGGHLDAELVGWLGLADKAKQLLADEAAGRLRNEAIPDWAEGRPVAELLLKGGANHLEILKLALPRIQRPGHDPQWAKKLEESCGWGEVSCLRLLLEHCDVAACAPTILHEIASGEWPQSQNFRPEEERVIKAEILRNAGARLDTRDDWSTSTPLAHACHKGRIDLVRLFLSGAGSRSGRNGRRALGEPTCLGREEATRGCAGNCCEITSIGRRPDFFQAKVS